MGQRISETDIQKLSVPIMNLIRIIVNLNESCIVYFGIQQSVFRQHFPILSI